MRYLEDYISILLNGPPKNMAALQVATNRAGNDYEFLFSIQDQLNNNRTLTTRQGAAIKRIFSKYDEADLLICGIIPKDFRDAITTNAWRNALRISVERRNEARYIGDNLIALSYNSSDADAKQLAKSLNARWSNKLHIVAVTRHNLDNLINFIGRFGLALDSSTEEYLALCMSSQKMVSHFVCIDDGVAVNITDDELLSSFVITCGGEVL